MCGFVAIIGEAGTRVEDDELKRATNLLTHRGPDDVGFYSDGSVGLGFRRLSILDLSQAGHQPFVDEDESYVIVFNGEIFNYVELREELRALGHSFKSSGDTEVLLASYKQWGAECLPRLNGMWAFVIYDKRNQRFFGARDRFGIKPLFYSVQKDRVVFASEIKALHALCPDTAAFNWSIASQYLLDARLNVPDPSGETMYDGVSEIPAAHSFTVATDGSLGKQLYWALPGRSDVSRESPVDEFAEIFADSVRLRMRSDVPLGVCLSGGHDSTSVICQLAENLGSNRAEPLRAFSFNDENYDESEQIAATVDQTSATLTLLEGGTTQFLDRLESVLAIHDEPLHSLNVLVSYELYRLAAEAGVKVILNGQGADETWAGYHSYFNNYWYRLLFTGRVSRCLDEIASYSSEMEQDKGALFSRTLKMLVRNQIRRIPLYRMAANSWQRSKAVKDPWFTADLFARYRKPVPKFEHLDLNDALRSSVKLDPLPLYLRIEDRNSMAHSVECRVPFLDYRLVELAFRSGDDWKLRGALNKFTLRRAMDGRIPPVVNDRVRKYGFPVSASEWFAGPLYDYTRDIVGSKSARETGLFNNDRILADLENHKKGRVDHSQKLLRVLQFQLLQGRIAKPGPGRA